MRQFVICMLAVLCLLTFNSSASFAQGGGAPEDWHLGYGKGYYEAGDFENAAMYFRQATGMNAKSAKAYFYLGQAYTKLKKTEEASAAFKKAIELDSTYADKIADFTGEKKSNSNGDETLESRISQAPFKEGDVVEVKDHGSDQWVRGTVISVEDKSGNGTRFAYKVRYRSVADWVEYGFYPDRIRVTSGVKPTGKATKNTAGDALFYADYVCTEDYFAGGQRRSDNRGTLSLEANGAYTFRGSSGRYKYNQETGEITWTSGYLSADENTTKFKRNQNTAQIDITFKTVSGNLDWSCGANLK